MHYHAQVRRLFFLARFSRATTGEAPNFAGGPDTRALIPGQDEKKNDRRDHRPVDGKDEERSSPEVIHEECDNGVP